MKRTIYLFLISYIVAGTTYNFPLHESEFYKNRASEFYTTNAPYFDTLSKKMLFFHVLSAKLRPLHQDCELSDLRSQEKNVAITPQEQDALDAIILPLFDAWIEKVVEEDSFEGSYWLKPAYAFTSHEHFYRNDKTKKQILEEKRAYCLRLAELLFQDLRAISKQTHSEGASKKNHLSKANRILWAIQNSLDSLGELFAHTNEQYYTVYFLPGPGARF